VRAVAFGLSRFYGRAAGRRDRTSSAEVVMMMMTMTTVILIMIWVRLTAPRSDDDRSETRNSVRRILYYCCTAVDLRVRCAVLLDPRHRDEWKNSTTAPIAMYTQRFLVGRSRSLFTNSKEYNNKKKISNITTTKL